MERGSKGNALSVVCKREKSPRWTLKYGNLIKHYSPALNFLLWNSRIPARHGLNKKKEKISKRDLIIQNLKKHFARSLLPKIEKSIFTLNLVRFFFSCFLFCWFFLIHLLHAIPTEKPPASCAHGQPSTSGSDPWGRFLHAATAETETAGFPTPLLPLPPRDCRAPGTSSPAGTHLTVPSHRRRMDTSQWTQMRKQLMLQMWSDFYSS